MSDPTRPRAADAATGGAARGDDARGAPQERDRGLPRPGTRTGAIASPPTPPAPADQLVWSLAREARPGDVAVVGVATPIAAAAAMLARDLLVPDMTVIVAASVDPAPHDIAEPMRDAGAVASRSVGTLSQAQILDAIQRGRITLQFISPAQVDGQGRLNTSRVARPDGSIRRLPGGLATGDISVLVGRLVAYRAGHSPRFLAREVTFTTGAGHVEGDAWRRERQLPGAGCRAIVTDLAVMRWDEAHTGFRLESVHEGALLDEVVAGCGFPLLVDDHVPTTEPPSDAAMELLGRVIDPLGVRRMEVPAERAAAAEALTAAR